MLLARSMRRNRARHSRSTSLRGSRDVGENNAPRTERANIDNAVAMGPSTTHIRRHPAAEAVEEFNRYNVRCFVIADASLQWFHIRGTFDANKPERLVTFLGQRLDLSVVETQEEIRLGFSATSSALDAVRNNTNIAEQNLGSALRMVEQSVEWLRLSMPEQ